MFGALSKLLFIVLGIVKPSWYFLGYCQTFLVLFWALLHLLGMVLGIIQPSWYRFGQPAGGGRRVAQRALVLKLLGIISGILGIVLLLF